MIFCMAFAFVHLVLDGTLLRLWALHRDQGLIQNKISDLLLESEKLQIKIDQSFDPNFIEQQARDRFDLVSEGELVFVFSPDQ